MTHSSFMPSWAVLLRERYLERSRQQKSHAKGRQAYYYEIRKKSTSKPHQKPDHDIASCPYVLPGQTQKDEPKPPSATSAPNGYRIKAIPVHLIPVWESTSAAGTVYEPVALVSHEPVNTQIRKQSIRGQALVNTESLPYNKTTKVENKIDNRATEVGDREDGSETVSEYGFYCEEQDLPRYNDNPPYHRDLIAQHGQYALTGTRWPTPTPLHDSRRTSTPPPSPGMHSHHHPYYSHAGPHQHDHVRHAHHHRPYHPHRQDCACDRHERCRANRHNRQHAAVELPRQPFSTPMVRNAYRQHSPASPRTYYPARVSFRTERRPSYVRTRTPSPRRREV